MEFKNFTPHPIHIVGEDGVTVVRTFESEGLIRVSQKTDRVGHHDGVPLSRSTFGETVGLPEMEDGVMLIVSIFVFNANPERTDLCIPVELVRDATGNIIGCLSLGIH